MLMPSVEEMLLFFPMNGLPSFPGSPLAPTKNKNGFYFSSGRGKYKAISVTKLMVLVLIPSFLWRDQAPSMHKPKILYYIPVTNAWYM